LKKILGGYRIADGQDRIPRINVAIGASSALQGSTFLAPLILLASADIF
jgi:hypothetical protein